MCDDEFCPPPEAPVFEPNERDFADPLGYIAKIRPIAEKAGICKVRPPPYWQPPFAIDVENFKFIPRIQRLNELGIQTRMRLQFLSKVAKFWELQGTTFKLPHIAGKPLDLYGLHRIVEELGGFEMITKNRQWNTVCAKLGLIKNLSATIRQHYEKLLYPYDIMLSGVVLESLQDLDKDFASKIPSRYHVSDKQNVKDEVIFEEKQRSKRRYIEDALLVDVSNNKELAKLQLFGAGPKMMGLGLIAKRKNRIKSKEVQDSLVEDINKSTDGHEHQGKNIFDIMECEKKDQMSLVKTEPLSSSSLMVKSVETRRKGSDVIPYSVLDSIDNCKVCMRDDNESFLLLCDGCDDNYHTYCLIPPLQNVPKGDWRCPKCLAKECNKKMDAYGFEQARKEYTLQSFGEMADTFKSEYFTKPAHMVPTDHVEKEFWRLVGSLEEDLSVQYGADIHVLDHGSGFPRLSDEQKHSLSPEEVEYAESGWNLNNLPVAKQSLLSCMSGDISGMKVPWVYVGMCFSAFCWHIEDHWTYSINYLHWGEPKTWYGVPREDAEKLEGVMKNIAPELFKQHPDVMHHLVTTINPSTLMKNGVRVVRTNQCAGEFVITFPRAYHAGFNQGYNFAEAVNFCPADWIPIGRKSVSHYRMVGRPCVFSHEEIICKVANCPEMLDVQLAASVHKDMVTLILEETEARNRLQKLGVNQTERIAFELVPDDERQCCICKTTCFLSAVICSCIPERIVCPHHVLDLCKTCSISQYILRYRYKLEELSPMLSKVQQRAHSFDEWSGKVEKVLNETKNKWTVTELRQLREEAAKSQFPENDKLHQLHSAIIEADKCSKLAQQLLTVKKHRTRQKELSSATGIIPSHSSSCMLSLNEIRAFYQQLMCLPCRIENFPQVCEYVKRVERFVEQAEMMLQEEEPPSKNIEALIENSMDFDLDLPQIPLLHSALRQAKWLEKVRTCLLSDVVCDDSKPPSVTLDQLRQLIDSGVSVTPRPAVEQAMAELQELLNLSEMWEEKASSFLDSSNGGILKTAEVITSESENVPVELPYCSRLREVVNKANSWINKLQAIQNQDYYPYLEALESLLCQAPQGVKLQQMPLLTTQVEAAHEWKVRTSRAFLKKNSLFTLLDILSPRIERNERFCNLKMMRRKRKDAELERQLFIENSTSSDSFSLRNQMDPTQVVETFKYLEKKEVEVIKELRLRNKKKTTFTNSSVDANETISADSNRYCLCNKPSSGFMLECELCHDLFHVTCVPPIRFHKGRNRLQQIYELKFLCPLCHRSRRPRLEIILSLLLQLQKLPVRIKEGEALQCLTERAMNWQDRTQAVLKLPECVDIIKQIDEKLNESGELFQLPSSESSATHSLLDKTSHTPAPTSKRLSSLGSIDDTIDTVLSKTSDETCQSQGSSGVDALLSAASKTDTTEDVMEAAEVLAMFACGSTQNLHAGVMSGKESNSSGKKQALSENACKISDSKRVRDLPLSKFPLVVLTPDLKAQLEALMMEGDLLEVTLDETQQIWAILQASRSFNDARFLELYQADGIQGSATVIEKEGKKKRKTEANMNANGDKRRRQKFSSEGCDAVSASKKSENIRKKRNQTKKSALDALVAADDDEFAICAISDATGGAKSCQQPTGEEVDWLQCDGGCEAWFHCVCVSVSAEEAKDLDYVCERCNHGRVDKNSDPSSVTSLARLGDHCLNVIDHSIHDIDFTCSRVSLLASCDLGVPSLSNTKSPQSLL